MFDTRLSGSTANTIILSDRTLTCCNVGDSRCILGTMDKRGHNLWKASMEAEGDKAAFNDLQDKERKMFWRCISLSKDHKPTIEAERK